LGCNSSFTSKISTKAPQNISMDRISKPVQDLNASFSSKPMQPHNRSIKPQKILVTHPKTKTTYTAKPTTANPTNTNKPTTGTHDENTTATSKATKRKFSETIDAENDKKMDSTLQTDDMNLGQQLPRTPTSGERPEKIRNSWSPVKKKCLTLEESFTTCTKKSSNADSKKK